MPNNVLPLSRQIPHLWPGTWEKALVQDWIIQVPRWSLQSHRVCDGGWEGSASHSLGKPDKELSMVLPRLMPDAGFGSKNCAIELATWCKEPAHWERPWCWESLRARGEGAAKDEMVGWHHWLSGHESEQTPKMVKDRESGVLQFVGLQRVRHNLVAEQQQGVIEEELAPQILMLMSGARTCQNGIKQKERPVYMSAWCILGKSC